MYVSGNCAHKLEAILFSENSQTQRASATCSKDQEWNDWLLEAKVCRWGERRGLIGAH